MKHNLLIVSCVVLLASIIIPQMVFGQSYQASTSVSLNYLNLQLGYPSETLPTQAVAVSVQASAKDSFHLNKLVVHVYYGDGSGLRLLTTATIANSSTLNKGDQVSGLVQFTVPADAPRTSLVAVVSESFRIPDYIYSPYYYPYSYWYYPTGNPSSPIFLYANPPNNLAGADDALAPLSYVKATTPEYVTLQNEYQMLQQQLTQSQAQNQQLQQKLQDTTNQKNSAIADLTQQLAAAQASVRTFETVSLILAIVAIALAFILVRARMKRQRNGK